MDGSLDKQLTVFHEKEVYDKIVLRKSGLHSKHVLVQVEVISQTVYAVDPGRLLCQLLQRHKLRPQ